METYIKIGLGVGVVGVAGAVLYFWIKKREDKIAKEHYSIGIKDKDKAIMKLKQKFTEKYNMKEEELEKIKNDNEKMKKFTEKLLHQLILLKQTNNLSKNITEKELLELIDAPLNPEIATLLEAIKKFNDKSKSKNTTFSPENFEANWIKSAILSNV